MKIATYNVNSIRARLPNLLDWLKEADPDVVFLQEIKVETQNFPVMELHELGYQTEIHGQKSYNGVATLSKQPITRLSDNLLEDTAARYLEVEHPQGRLINVYVPNGNPVESDKFSYKLRWLEALHDRARNFLVQEVPFLIGGDFNIIPEAADCHDSALWKDDALFKPEIRAVWRKMLNLGMVDAFRALNRGEKEAYTFWDYQGGAWRRNNGIRIDHFLLSPQMADQLSSCTIDASPRGREKASDHTPVIAEFDESGEKNST